MEKEIFEKYESKVRSYCRTFPKMFDYAKGSKIRSVEGKEYIDFFCGAGALNYGHNNDYIKSKVVEYIMNDGIIHSLDMYTKVKEEFIECFQRKILEPRGLNYKIQFTGPTGTNANEAALKLARKVKKRNNIFALMGAFHGMTMGSLALTSDYLSRAGAGVSLENVTHIPAPYMFKDLDVLEYIRTILMDDHSAIEKPAAIVIETIQAEGGIYVFSKEFLQGLRGICDEFDILLIVDDIQVGCSRSGAFFSFERAGVIPDIVTLSKSIGGYGFPLALTLFKPELDVWEPGEHNGTFRGNQVALVAGKAAIELTLEKNIEKEVKRKSKFVEKFLNEKIKNISKEIEVRGLGLIWGIDVKSDQISKDIVKECFDNGLIIERAGRNNSVVKIMPALTIEDDVLLNGLEIIEKSVKSVFGVE